MLFRKLAVIAICMGGLAGCVEYKTRGFVQTGDLTFENWRLTAEASAFSGSSSASWDDHSFRVSAGAVLDGDPEMSAYTVSLSDLALHTGLCGAENAVQIEVGETDGRMRATEASLYRSGGGDPLIIPGEIDHICISATARFTPKTEGDDTVEAYEFDLKRKESSFYFLPMV